MTENHDPPGAVEREGVRVEYPPAVEVHEVPRGSIVTLRGMNLDTAHQIRDEIRRAVGHDDFLVLAPPPDGPNPLTVINPEDVAAFLAGHDFRPPAAPVPTLEVLAHVHLYPPSHNAGAEMMLHAILKRLRDVHGMKVRVITNRLPRRRNSFEGIPVECIRDARSQQGAYAGADVVLTHLDATGQAMGNVRRTGQPLVHLVHNHAQLGFHHVPERFAQLVVFNSQWIADAVAWAGPSMIVNPPVWSADYELDHRTQDPRRASWRDTVADAVTLINCSEAKGGALFWALAERFPDVTFLGVAGSYGEQVPPPDLPNVTFVPNQADIRDVYRVTKVLMMPSAYESWGRVAVEAGCAGIPTIASATPGLLECGVPWLNLPVNAEQRRAIGGFDRAATVADDHTLDVWTEHLARLLGDPEHYALAQAHAVNQARHLEAQSEAQVDELAARLLKLAG